MKKSLIALMKQPIVLKLLQEISVLGFFISCFTVSVTPTINAPKTSNDFMILLISFISSFEIKKVNPFHALATPSLLILFKLFIAFEAKLLTNPGALSLARVMAKSDITFFA